MGQLKMRALKRAARQLGLTSTTLRQQGWKTASPGWVSAARDNPPEWLAVIDANADAVDAWWAPEVRQAKRETRRLAGELAPGQVRERTGRERDTSNQAACYRAGQLLRRALEG